MNKRYIVRLSKGEREGLGALLRKGKTQADRIRHAQILLKADEKRAGGRDDGEARAEKNELKPHLKEQWCIPPKANAEFVAQMEEVLELYQMPYDPEVPLVCMDEQPRPLIQETRRPIPMQEGSPLRYDFEYERNGTANIFLFTEPLGCKRSVHVREQKTKRDWAEEVKRLLDDDYPDVKRVRLVCDNLNTHTIGALYEAFVPGEARRLARRLELHHTPKHGSWLNIAEIELSVMTRQYLQRRIPEKEMLKREVTAWAMKRNAQQHGVDWQFTTSDARVRLKRLYPQFQMS